MTFDETIETVDRLCEAEESRSELFRNELDAFEQGDRKRFRETRSTIDRERPLLQQLNEQLDKERDELEALEAASDSLTVDQAVEHRDEGLTKLETHNDLLREFSSSLTNALDVIEGNLDRLENEGIDAELDDPQPSLQSCRETLEEHNDAIDGIDRNLTILNAYLL